MESVLLFCTLVFLFYVWHMLGVTVGLHRLLSHKAFRCHKLFEYFLVFGAYLAYHGSPVWWACIHRTHHRYSDTPLDPHTPTKGIFQSYTFYRGFEYPAHMDTAKQCPDLLKDPIYKYLETDGDWRVGYAKCIAFNLVFRGLLFLLFGWEVCLASFVAGFLAFNVPLIVNIVCHIPNIGYRNFETRDASENVWYMAILAFGDGWHNNHHEYPASSKMGIRSHEIDLSYLTLKFFKAIGLVYSINTKIPSKVPVTKESSPTLMGSGK